MTPQELFQLGKLSDAIDAALQTVKSDPSNTNARSFLVVLLCFAGDWERADRQLETLTRLHNGGNPDMALLAIRQLIRAEEARAAFYNDGAVPEFLQRPEGAARQVLQASIKIREGTDESLAEAVTDCDEAEMARQPLSVTWQSREHDARQTASDYRDLDDLLSPITETLTGNGDYYWVPNDQIVSMKFHAPTYPVDLLWRRVSLIVKDGPEADVYIPVTYFGSAASDDEALKLGRATDWVGGDESDAKGPVRGLGQRTLLIGEEDIPIMDLVEINFSE